MHPRYEEWISHVFDHPVAHSAWYWDSDESFEGSEVDYVTLLDLTFRRSGTELTRFSDAQVNQGLWYLSSCSCSDYMSAMMSEAVPLADRVSAIGSIGVLYRDCFAARCTKTLSHLDEAPCSDLNVSCYMFWDNSCLSALDRTKDNAGLINACFDVLADTLLIDHAACQEAAVHGYGHFQYNHSRRVETALDAYLRTKISDSRLRTYAGCARSGLVQ